MDNATEVPVAGETLPIDVRAELAKAKKQFFQHPWRKVGTEANNWTSAWLAHVGQMVLDGIKLKEPKREDCDNIDYLLNSDLINFRNGANPHLPLMNWSADEWQIYLETNQNWTVKVYKKVANILPLNIHKSLVEFIFNLVNNRRMELVEKYAFDVIRISFPKCEALLNYETKLSTIQTCRFKTFEVNKISHLYLKFWRIIYETYPRRSADISTKMLAGHDMTQQSEKDGHGVQPIGTVEFYILEISLMRKNMLRSNQSRALIPYKIAMLKFWESLDFNNLENVFRPPVDNYTVLDQLFHTIGYLYFEGGLQLHEDLSYLVVKLCRYLASQECPRLQYHLENLCSDLLCVDINELSCLKMALQISIESGEKIASIPSERWSDSFYRLDRNRCDVKQYHDVALLYTKVLYPAIEKGKFDNMVGINQLLGYGTETFGCAGNDELSVRQTELLANIYHLHAEARLPRSLAEDFHQKLFSKRYCEFNFGGIKWTHETFPDFFKALLSLAKTQMARNIQEFELPEKDRIFLHPENGLVIFEGCYDLGLTFILATIDKNYQQLNSTFQIEGSPPMDIFNQKHEYHVNSLLSYDKVEVFLDGMRREVSHFVKGYENNLEHYFALLMDLVTTNMEVYNFESLHKSFFEEFYVPTVRGLLPFHPFLALDLIVAFCRAELRLNLVATYPDTAKFKADWQRIRALKTPEFAREFFEKFNFTQSEVYAENAPVIPYKEETMLMERFVAATVKEHEVYDWDEVMDYLVICHYYDILDREGISKEDLKMMTNEEVQDILLKQETEE